MARDGDASLFEAKIEDLCRRAEKRYETAIGDFLTPGEVMRAKTILSRLRPEGTPVFFGGYEGSERARLVVLPSYLEWEEGDALLVRYPEEAQSAVAAVRIEGSGYRKLSHRDYMGSILALGLERSVIGDIVAEGEYAALVFCDPKIAAFLLQELQKIANDSVRVKAVALSPDFRVERQFAPVRDTVASARLDCIVAALAGLSREKAQMTIRFEEVEVDYQAEKRPDRLLAAGNIVTIRRVGKFVIRSVDEQTKKGRYRLAADKYM